MTWQNLQNRLADAFTTDGIVGKKLVYIAQYEADYGSFVERTFRGHSILSRAFQEFYANSIESAAAVWEDPSKRSTPPTYSEVVLWHLGNFRNLRAVDILFHSGYPMDGLARLRHLKESAVFLAAIQAGHTDYLRVNGMDQMPKDRKLNSGDMVDIRKRRKREEKRVLDLMLRTTSGLSNSERAEIERWESFFNEEVHGARLTLMFEHGPAITGEDTTSVAPKPRTHSLAMFMNRFCEVSWMLHRTLPSLQLKSHRFGPEWDQKWQLIDDNFRCMEDDVLAKNQKPIGQVFMNVIAAKFPFGPQDAFDK